MNNFGKIATVIGVLVIVGVVGIYIAGVFNNGGNGGNSTNGIDVSNTPCDGIGAARKAVDDEYTSRQEAVENKYKSDMEEASDAYWDEYNNLEAAKYACESDALLADPCRDYFERSSQLAQEILAGIDQGYDETKHTEREQAKSDYDECLKNPPEEDTYEGKKTKCEADFSASVAAAQSTREQSEGQAVAFRDQSLNQAEQDYNSKHSQLDAIAEECNRPAPKTGLTVGGVTTEGTGTVIQSGSSACTGSFTGYDSEIQAQINRLQSLYNQAVAGGKYEGLTGANQYSAKISELRAQMAAGDKSCEVDSDCGDSEPVCCSGTQLGKVMCDGGICISEIEDCEDDEICTGKPAQCVSPTVGLKSSAISLQDVVVIGGVCNGKLRLLDLQPASEKSVRFEITGNFPGWMHFSHVGGSIPQPIEVTYNCQSLIGFGEGIYETSAIITIYDGDDNLINTIPVNISIRVIAGTVIEKDETNVTTGGTIVTEDDESEEVVVGPGRINFTYDHAKPTCPLSITPVNISGPIGSTWSLNSNLPIWLAMPQGNQGTVPATIPLQFPCMLDKYENQTQSTNLQFQINTPDGIEHNAGVEVGGTFISF